MMLKQLKQATHLVAAPSCLPVVASCIVQSRRAASLPSSAKYVCVLKMSPLHSVMR